MTYDSGMESIGLRERSVRCNFIVSFEWILLIVYFSIKKNIQLIFVIEKNLKKFKRFKI